MHAMAHVISEFAIKVSVLLMLFKYCYGFWGIDFGGDVSTESTSTICNVSLISKTKSSAQCTCNIPMNETDCSNLGIRELPSSISFPNTVRIANFKGNEIVDIKDDTFHDGKEITELDLSNNMIDFISVETFITFEALQRLIVSHNAVWTLHLDVFDPLTQLMYLDLSFNDIGDIYPGIFKRLELLTVLKLNSNPLKDLKPKIFEPLVKLRRLEMSSTMLKTVPELVFTFTPSLRFLNFSSILLTEIPTNSLSILKKLETLDLSLNTFEIVGSSSFRGLESLSVLYLNNITNLTSVEAFAFGDLNSLSELYCSYNGRLSHMHEDAFVDRTKGNRSKIAKLFMSRNNLDTLPPGLLPWRELTKLDLSNNPWHCDCRLKWMMNLDVKDQFQNQIQCSQPQHLEGKTLSRIERGELVCGLTVTEAVIIGCAAAAAVLLLSLVMGIVLHRRKFIVHTVDSIIYLRMLDDKQVESDTESQTHVF